MANILISSLGTGIKKDGGYKKATYMLDGKEDTTPFISKALSNFLKIDKIFLVGTKGSIWDSCYSEFGGDDENAELSIYEKIEKKDITEDDLRIVEKSIDKSLGKNGSKCFIIEYGLDDKELWKNFSQYIKILDEIRDGDIVYIDITHAFRSLSLMSFLMVQFGQVIKDKKFDIGGIYYGMFEATKDGITPVVNLKLFYDLMQWIKAIDNFKNYANGDNIATLLKNSKELKEEYNIFNNYTQAMRIANMAAVKHNVNSIAKKLSILKESQNPIINLMTSEMKEFIERLNKEKMSDFQLELAFWYHEHKHYALSYMALAEAIVSKSCEYNGIKPEGKENRKRGKQSIWKMNKSFHKEVYKNVNNIRNNIAHQLQNRKEAMHSDINNLKIYLEKTKNFFDEKI